MSLFYSFLIGGGDKYEVCVQKSEEAHVEGNGVDPVGQLLLVVAGVVHVQRHHKDEKTKEHLWHLHRVLRVFVHFAWALFPIRGTQLCRSPYQHQALAVLKFDDSRNVQIMSVIYNTLLLKEWWKWLFGMADLQICSQNVQSYLQKVCQ